MRLLANLSGAVLCCVSITACGASTTAQEPPASGDRTETPAHRHAEHHGHGAATAHHRFDDAERWAKVFDDPERDAWQMPEAVLDFMRLADDAAVADLGAGTGYFSVRLAHRLPRGKVFAVDIEPKLLEHLAQRAAKAKLTNVETVLAEASDPKLPSGLDAVLVVDTYHHISERVSYFERVRKQLKPDGRVVIVDFRLGDLPVGPPDEHKISRDQTHTELEAAGFQLCDELKSLPYQYVLSFGTRC